MVGELLAQPAAKKGPTPTAAAVAIKTLRTKHLPQKTHQPMRSTRIPRLQAHRDNIVCRIGARGVFATTENRASTRRSIHVCGAQAVVGRPWLDSR
jgi:hypothetical protein